ncbi:flagellar filament capping protein FliD, partial [Vibrio campbellii]
ELEGVNASVVRTDGELNLLLSSEETGTENAFDVSFSNLGAGTSLDYNALSDAEDAVIYLGGEDGLRVTSSNNTFDDVIYGVSFE